MTTASIITIGDEILIGQILDTNSRHIAAALEESGIMVNRMTSIRDNREEILEVLSKELISNDIVITTGGLGPTKDDITKDALKELSGSAGYVEHPGQLEEVERLLQSRGLQMLESNRAQALVPEKAEVIVNRLGTAPVMVFRSVRGGGTLYSLPGVPFEATGALKDVLRDIKAHFPMETIHHRSLMVFGMAESALAELIAPWEDALPRGMHLAYLPDLLTGVRLRLSFYGGDGEQVDALMEREILRLKDILGNRIYALEDSRPEIALGRLLRSLGKTVSAAESCTGGEVAHLITMVPGSSDYFLGSVTSYAAEIKEKVLGVPHETIAAHTVVSSEVAAAMAEGVRRLTGSDYSVATTGLAGPSGDGKFPIGTIWIGVSGPSGTRTRTFCFHNDRERNIERFAATAIDFLRLFILEG